MEILNQKLLAGTDWAWTESVADYPADSYTLRYILKDSAATELTINSSEDEGLHSFSVNRTTTNISAGFYAFQAFAVLISDGTVTPLDFGAVEVLPNIDSVSDSRSFALKMVENLRTAILALSAKTMSEFVIDGRQYKYRDLGELNKQLNYWEDKAGLNKGTSGRVLIQFGKS